MDAEFAESLPEVFRAGFPGFGSGAHPVQRAGGLEVATDALLQHALLFAQCEFHQEAPLVAALGSAAFGSFGRPRARSPIMFFWICAVPPPMMRPRSIM